MLQYIVILGLCLSINAEVLPRARQNDGRIVGGKPIDIQDIPYQVSININGFHYCGGSILSQRFILTAAHCTEYRYDYDTIVAYYSVRTGSNHSDTGGSVHRIKDVHRHEMYNPYTMDYDFSILELENPILFYKTRRPVRLPQSGEEVGSGTMLRTSGWGDTQNVLESDFHVRAVSVPAVSDPECLDSYPDFTNRMLCAGYRAGGKDTCQGDSGGPIVRESDSVLVGVVSFGRGCALPGYPGVYAKVSRVRHWIRKVTGL